MSLWIVLRRALFLVVGLSLLNSGCDRPLKNKNAASIVFKMPSHPDINQKSANQTMSVTTPQVCYMVNVVAPDLLQGPDSCLPPLGVTSPLMPPNSEVTMMVNKGRQRVFEMYAYLTVAGESCQDRSSLRGASAQRIFLMGVSEPQELDQDEETVILKVRFPGLLHSLAHTGSYPSHCWSQGSGGGQANQQTDFNGGILKSTHYVLKGSISSGINNSSLKIGSNYRLRGGLSHVVQ